MLGLCTLSSSAHAVVEGELTAEFPSVGALMSPAHPDFAVTRCTATLIGCETLLTAAHCVCRGDSCKGDEAPRTDDFLFFLPNAGFFSVASVIVHPSFSYPHNDLAVIKLNQAVAGVPPSPVQGEESFAMGVAGTIVGYGTSGHLRSDFGLKRKGEVVIDNYTSLVHPNAQSASNTCYGDSGGPIFADGALVGISTFLSDPTCVGDLPLGNGSLGFNVHLAAEVGYYPAFIQSAAGSDLGRTCGNVAPLGSGETEIANLEAAFDLADTSHPYSFEVGPETQSLAIASTGTEDAADFDLYVKFGSPPSLDDFDCKAAGPGQFGFCHMASPQVGTWYATLVRYRGRGAYQLTVTRYSAKD